MVQSDTLSWRADLHPDEDNNNEDMTLLPDDLFMQVIDTKTHSLLVAALMKDDLVKSVVEVLKTGGIPPIKSVLTDWKLEDGLLFFVGRCYVPPNEVLHKRIVEHYHDTLSSGHPGQFQTLKLIRRDYWWPGMMIFIKNYVPGYTTCQQMKINMHLTIPPLSLIKSTTTQPFAVVTTDFITDLPESKGFDSIMVMVDQNATKGVIFILTNKTVSMAKAACLYYEKVYTRFGLPDKIISDRDPHFASNLFQELGKLLGVKLAMSTTYHPQTDGKTEQVNQELEIYLQTFCSNEPETWKHYLPTAEFAHNQKTHSAVKHSPFYLMMGYEPLGLPTAFPKMNVPEAEKRLTALFHACNKAQAAHELARQMMMEQITQKFVPFKKGDEVWLDSKNLKLPYPMRKLAPKREGPFPIIKVISPLSYRLKLLTQWKIHPMFHVHLLTPF
jgi:hypothetical protein